jgi:lysine 2,3-aminomutase
MEEQGEERGDYEGLYGYSLGQTERRVPVYDYPGYDFKTTSDMTNLEV